MSNYEALSVVLSCIAAIVSLIAWNGQRKLQREANDLQKVTADLSRKQLQLIKEQEHVKHIAKLSLRLVRNGNSHTLVISNASNADALAIDLRPLGDSILIDSEVQAKLPIKRLRPGDEVRMVAAVYFGNRSVHEFLVTWQNADGSSANEEFSVSV